MTQIGMRRKFNPCFRITTIFTGFFLGLFIFFICLPTIILFKIWSNLSYLVKKIQYGRSVSRVHKIDKTHCTDIDKSYSYINANCRFKGKLDIDFIKEKVRKTTYGCPDKAQRKRFRRIIQVMEMSMGYSYFRDDETFDINNHIKEIKKEEIFGDELDDTELEKMSWESLVGKLLEIYGTKSVDAGPQWEMVFYKESEERFTGLFRFHHSITDGVNYLRFMMETLADNDAAVGKMPYKYRKPNILYRAAVMLMNFCIYPFAVFDMAMIGRTMKNNSLLGPKLSGKKHFLLSKPVPVALVKDIKKKTDTPLNVTFFSAYSHALNEYFKIHNEKVKDCWMLFPLPKNNVDEPVRLINRFKYSFVNLPLGKSLKYPHEKEDKRNDSLITVTNPALQRLYEIKKYMSYYRRDVFVHAVVFILESVYANFPLFLLKRVICNKGFLSIYSSVAASMSEVEMFHSTLEEVSFVGFDQNPNGLFLSIIGYKDKLRAGLMVDHALIPCKKQAQKILDDFVSEIHRIHEALRDHDAVAV